VRGVGEVHLYTGEGGGKTTTAIGVGVRAVGHGFKVVMIQFMKGRKVGEYKAIKEKLTPLFEIYQFGREEFVNLENPEPIDYELAQKALEFAREKLKEKPFLLILDEINVAAAIGLVKVEDVIRLLNEAPKETTIILTGRYAPRALIDRADLVTFMACIKHPYHEGMVARKGIEY